MINLSFSKMVALGLGLMLAGQGNAQEQTQEEKQLVFGYVQNTFLAPSNQAAIKGFNEEAEKVGVRTVILDSRLSTEQQANAIDDLLAQNIDAIAFVPTDSVVAQGWVDKMAEAGVPAVASLIMVGDARTRELYDVYPNLSALVISDDVGAGASSAELAARYLPRDRTAKIAIIEGNPGAGISLLRIKGFERGLQESGIDYEIVASQPTDWTPQRGESVCQNIITANPDLDLIFSLADDMAIGCARAMSGLGVDIPLVATAGGAKMGNDAIAAGELLGSVCYKFETLGRMTFHQMLEAVQNPDAVKARFVTYDSPLITKENLAQCPPEW